LFDFYIELTVLYDQQILSFCCSCSRCRRSLLLCSFMQICLPNEPRYIVNRQRHSTMLMHPWITFGVVVFLSWADNTHCDPTAEVCVNNAVERIVDLCSCYWQNWQLQWKHEARDYLAVTILDARDCHWCAWQSALRKQENAPLSSIWTCVLVLYSPVDHAAWPLTYSCCCWKTYQCQGCRESTNGHGGLIIHIYFWQATDHSEYIYNKTEIVKKTQLITAYFKSTQISSL